MDLTAGMIVTLLINIGTIIFTFGTMSTRLRVAEKTLEELKADFKLFSDLKAAIDVIRVEQVYNREALSRMERNLDKLTSKEDA